MSSPLQSHRFLQIISNLGKDALIISRASGVEALGRLFETQVEFTAAHDNLDLENLLGTSVMLRLDMSGEQSRAKSANTRYFSGFFSRITYGGFQREGRPVFRATVVPWLWFLTRTSDCRIFQQKSVREIIEKVFSDAGFSDYEFDLKGSYPVIEYCVQYRETDFQFVSRLMEREGMYYYFSHTKVGHKMVICDDMAAHKPATNFETLSFIGGSTITDKQGVITDWEFTSEIKSGVYAHNDFNFLTPGPDPNLRLLSRSSAPNPQKPEAFEIYDAPGGFPDTGEGSRCARLRMEELQADRDVASGRTNIQGLAAGHKFKLAKHPTKSQNRGYLITSVQWSVQEGAYGSGGGGGGEFFSCGFTCIPDSCVFRAARITPIPRIDGPQTAIVVGPPGDEIHVDEHGRVKVQFPWDREGKCDSKSSCWIRVSQPWAGPGFGGMAIPRIGQEVVVEFIEGNPDRPLITGRVYNGVAKPPYTLPEHATRTTIKTNSSKGGGGFNELRFEDKKGNEQIFIHGQKNLDVRIRNDIKETNYGNRHERIGWKTDEGSGGSHFVTIKEDENTHVEKKHYEMIDEDSHMTVKGEVLENHEKSHKTHVGQDHVLKAQRSIVETAQLVSVKTNKVKIEGANAVHLSAGHIVLEGTFISLKSGNNFISITPLGVEIKGLTVRINSGGNAPSAQRPDPAPEIKAEQPFDAKVAVDSVPGGKTRFIGGAPRVRGSGPLVQIKAPEYVPPPDLPEPEKDRVEPPGPIQSKKPCGIKEMSVACGHSGNRKVKSGGTIVVVPSPSSIVTTSEKFGQGEFSLEFAITTKTGGTDSVTIEVDTIEGGKGQSQISEIPTGGSGGAWGSGAGRVYGGLKNKPTRKWTLNSEAKTSYIYGKGCDDVIHQVTVKTLPPDRYEYAAKVEGFREFIKNINDGFPNLLSPKFGPAKLTFIIVPPSGELKLAYGWKEDEAPEKAVFTLSGSASVSMGAGFRLEVSLAQIAYAGLLSSAGVPPPVSTELAKILGDYIADILVGAELTATPKFTGEIFSKWYYPGGGDVGGKFAASVEGKLKAFMTGKVGNGKIAGISVTGAGETGIIPEGGIEVSTAGASLELSLKCSGLELSVSILFENFAFDWEEGFKWRPFDEFDICPPKSFKILTFD